MGLQNTQLEKFQKKLSFLFGSSLYGSWRRRSIGLLSLLVGYYLGSNATMYYLQKIGQRPIVVLVMVIIIELLIRLRSYVNKTPWPLHWLIIDNLRIGSIYSVCLEAFKLGS